MIRPARDVILIGGSAGAFLAVKAIVHALPCEFAGSMFIVLHRDPDPTSPLSMANVLARQTVVTDPRGA